MVESTALEMRHTGNRIGGSNPSLSASTTARNFLRRLPNASKRPTTAGFARKPPHCEAPVEILKVGNEAEQTQRRRMARVRAERDAGLVEQRLAALRSAAAEDRNIIPAMLDCARAYCTLYEIRHVLEEIYGNYREPVFF